MRYVIALALALAATLGLAAPASAAPHHRTHYVAVPAGESAYVYDGAISTAEDCTARVTVRKGVTVWRDYTRTGAPITTCEGESFRRTFTVGTPDSDGYWEYVIGARV